MQHLLYRLLHGLLGDLLLPADNFHPARLRAAQGVVALGLLAVHDVPRHAVFGVEFLMKTSGWC